MSDNGLAPAIPTSELFPDEPTAPHFPRVVLQTTIEYEGYTFVATFNDMGIVEAAGVLKKRGCTPSALRAANPTTAATAPQTNGAIPNCQNRNCTRYGQPMEPSQHGNGTFYCKGKDATTGNQKGYCKSAG